MSQSLNSTRLNNSTFRLSLGARVFLSTSFLLIVALASIVFITIQTGKDVANKNVKESIYNSLALQNYFRDINNRELLIVLDGFASDPNFTAYVSEAVDTPEGEPIDLESIQDLLQERKDDAALDFIILLDPEGRVIIHSENQAMTGRDFSNKALLQPVIENLEEATGVWLENKQLFQTAIVPLSLDYDLIGFAIAGLAIDKSLANEMKAVGGGDTLFLIASDTKLSLVASTLNVAESAELIKELESHIGTLSNSNENSSNIRLNMNEESWSVQSVPLAKKEEGLIPLFVIYSSESKYSEGFERIFSVILIAAFISIALSMMTAYFLTRGILNPIKLLASASNSAAKGDYTTKVGISGDDELALLSNSIDSLLSDLRDKQDMQNYISELSKVLPEETITNNQSHSDPAKILPMAFQEYCLLAVDINGLLSIKKDLKLTHEKIQSISDLILLHGENSGALLIRLGNGVFILAFSGKNKEQMAFSTLGGIDLSLKEKGYFKKVDDVTFLTKYSLTSGHCFIDTIASKSVWQKFIVGMPVRQSIRLLEESANGRVLASMEVYKSLKPEFDKLNIKAKAVKGRLSGKTFCLMDRKAAQKFILPLSPEQTQVRATLVGADSHTQSDNSTSLDLTTGSVFAQRYEILTSLGSGSMGLVFKAMDRELNEPVAIKILRKEIADDKEHLERLKSEIKLARRVTHPNILRTYDLGKVGDTPFLSMEYVRGMTLRYLIDNSGKLPYSAALRVARQLCEGLDCVHQLGILHRDIKAENVILEPSGNLKLMDFGIARTLKKSEIDKLDEGLFVGTPSYASPEQVQAGELGVASDIYSMGILFNEIFTGELPIQGASVREILMAHVNSEPLKASHFWKEVPLELENIILKCLNKKPNERYQNIKKLLSDLMELSA
ncbi:MAG: protein kinase domain-containing protein [Kangiellaceae bacterium]